MTLTQEQLNDFVTFIEKLNLKQSSYYSGSLRPNSKKNECFKKVLSILYSTICRNKEPVHVTWISLILKYLLKVSLLIRNSQRFKLTSTAKGLFDINVIPDKPYKFEDYESLKLDFIRALRNKNDIDKAQGLNNIINNNYSSDLLFDDQYKAECYDAFFIVLDEIRSAESLEIAPYHHELNIKLGERCQTYKKQLLFKSETVALVYTAHCAFRHDLEKFLNNQKVQVPRIIISNQVDIWVRDIFIETNTKLYLRSRSNTRRERIDLSKQVDYSETRKHHTPNTHPRLADKIREIEHFTCLHRDIKETVRPLEGGNLFTAKNKTGQECYFIGTEAIIYDIDFHMAKGDPSFKKEIDLEIRKELIKQQYVKIFGVGSKVIILPQWTYHLDLQMAYIGKSTFLLHSFEKTEEFNNSKIPSEYDIVEKKIDEIYKILVKEGFLVHKCCAILYNDYPPDTKHLYDVRNVSSSFINGIDISTEKGDFFLTNDSPIDLHKDYFTNLMRQLKVTPVFLNISYGVKNPERTTEYIIENHGALRCQTNFIRVNE